MLAFLLLPLAAQAQKMIRQNVTVFSPDNTLQTIQHSVEAAVSGMDSLNLVYSETIKGGAQDLEEFWARTPVQGLIWIEKKNNSIEISFYSRGGDNTRLSFPEKLSIANLTEIQKRVKDKAGEFFPPKLQEVVVKENLVIKTVSPLEYYRPTFLVGFNLCMGSISFRSGNTNGDDSSFKLNLYRPDFVVDMHYKKFSISLRYNQFLYYNDNTMNLAGSWGLHLIPGLWLSKGFFYVGLDLSSFDLFFNNFPVEFPNGAWTLSVYPRLGFRFSENFSLFFNPFGGFQILSTFPGAVPVFNYNLHLESLIGLSPHWVMTFEFGLTGIYMVRMAPTDPNNSQGPELSGNESFVNLGVRYQFHLGGQK